MKTCATNKTGQLTVEQEMVSTVEHGGLLSRKLPQFEFRSAQKEMFEAANEALKNNEFLIIEAGTGIGKTLAYLIPAVLSRKQVVISTGTKNLQEQVYFKDIPLLKEILPLKFKASYMKGRNNYLCLKRFKQFNAQSFFTFGGNHSRYEELCEWAKTTNTGDRSELANLSDNDPLWNDVYSKSELCFGQKCESFKTCFITKVRQDAVTADIIIVNHHLFFADLAVKETGFGEILPRYEAVIFDEAHQLEDVATHYFGIVVSNYRFEELARDIQKGLEKGKIKDKDVYQTLHSFVQNQELFFNCFRTGLFRCRLKKETLQKDLFLRFSEVMRGLDMMHSKLIPFEERNEELRGCNKRISEIKDELAFIINMESPLYAFWYENKRKGIFLHASPIDVSHEFHSRLYKNVKSAIFTSATISTHNTFCYFKSRLGIKKETKALSLSSDFDYHRQTILYLPKVKPSPNTPRFVEAIAEEIEKLLAVTSGRAFVLFTSHKNMTEVYERIKGRLDFSVLLQGEKPKSFLLKKFKKDINSVLFATQSFWEGVDVQGEALSCVIIDKLPFASPSEPIVEARMESISKNGGNPFSEYQLPSAVISLKQGIGRLIRNKKDRGVLSILDNRILTKAYGQVFINSLPRCPITNNLTDIKKFFQS